TQENKKRLVWCFAFLFLSVNIAFAPDYSLSIPFETPLAALGGMAVLFCLLFGVRDLSKIGYQNLKDHIFSKLNMYSQKTLDNKSSANLALIGMCIWLLAIYFRQGAMVAPLVIAGTLVMIWSVMIFFEESLLVKAISTYSSSKKIFGFISACIVFWATYTTFGQVNSVFGVDPSYFPFTITVGIFINIAKVVALTSIVITPLSVIMSFINMFTSNHPFWSNSRQAVLYCTLILSSMIFLTLGFLWSDEFMHRKLLESAQVMDMNGNHLCHNDLLIQDGKKVPVIFIGPNSSLVLYNKDGKFDIADCNPLNKS
ncbi:hypothetical protein J7H92_004398, partial [Vibrio parahaemolyticus]|nr:hypothetical protein [Vibrio parahaemolyticus]